MSPASFVAVQGAVSACLLPWVLLLGSRCTCHAHGVSSGLLHIIRQSQPPEQGTISRRKGTGCAAKALAYVSPDQLYHVGSGCLRYCQFVTAQMCGAAVGNAPAAVPEEALHERELTRTGSRLDGAAINSAASPKRAKSGKGLAHTNGGLPGAPLPPRNGKLQAPAANGHADLHANGSADLGDIELGTQVGIWPFALSLSPHRTHHKRWYVVGLRSAVWPAAELAMIRCAPVHRARGNFVSLLACLASDVDLLRDLSAGF